jgi:hypothetical protein
MNWLDERSKTKPEPKIVYPQIVDIFREDYLKSEYSAAFQDCNQHYGYKVRLDGGWRFFEFSQDYENWKKQK